MSTPRKKILLFMKYFSSLVCNELTLKGCLFFFFILCSNVTFSQTSQTIVENNPIEIVSVKNENITKTSTTNNVNFVLWFMGSKQDTKSNTSIEETNTKKQVITSGTAPNRILIKTFLKKAINSDVMVA
jgi:hypothetical protein